MKFKKICYLQVYSHSFSRSSIYVTTFFFIPYWHQVLLSISIYTALLYILLSLLLFSFRLKNILKLYPLLKCTTSFSNIFHRNGYAIRPYILPFRIQFRTELLHKYTHSHTSWSITHIYIQFIEGLNKVY